MRLVGDIADLQIVGGVEVCTLEDTTELVSRGHHVDLFYGAEGTRRTLFESGGVVLHGPVSFKVSRRHALRDLLDVLPAIRAVRRLRPDVVWLSRAEHVVWGSLLAAAARVRLVAHLHHAPSSPRTRWLTRGVARFIAVSEFTKSQWVAAGVPADRIDVVHNALPPGRYPFGGAGEMRTAREALGLPLEGRVVTFYGRLSDEKGLPTVLEAFSLLDRRDVTLLLAGSAPSAEADALVRRAVESLGERIRVLPPSADVVPFLHAADVVATPSWVEEAFGRTIIETMSTGRPAIGARTGGVPELLEGGMEHLLVPSRDAAALLTALRSVLDWRETDPDLGARCSAWVQDRFSYSEHIASVESTLLRVTRS